MLNALFVYQYYVSFFCVFSFAIFTVILYAVWKQRLSRWLLLSTGLMSAAYVAKFLSVLAVMPEVYASNIFAVIAIFSNVAFAKNAQQIFIKRKQKSFYFEKLDGIIVLLALVSPFINFRLFFALSMFALFAAPVIINSKTFYKNYKETATLKRYALVSILYYAAVNVCFALVYTGVIAGGLNIFNKYQTFFDLLLGIAFLFYANHMRSEAQNISLEQQHIEKYLSKYVKHMPILAIVAAVLFTGFVLIEKAGAYYTKVRFGNLSAEMAQASDYIANNIASGGRLSASLSKLASVAKALEPRASKVDKDDIEKTINENAEIFGAAVVSIVSPEGKIVITTSGGIKMGMLGLDISKRKYIVEARKNGTGEWLFFGVESADLGYYIANAVKGADGKIKGFAVVKKNMSQTLDKAGLHEISYYVVDNSSGTVYFADNTASAERAWTEIKGKKEKFLSSSVLSGTDILLNGSFFRVIKKDIQGTPLSVVCLISLKEIGFLKFVMLLILLAVLFITVLVYIMFVQSGKVIALGMQHKALLNSAKSFAIISTGVDGKISLVNEGARLLFGYGEKELKGAAIKMLFEQNGGIKEKMRLASKTLGREISFMEYLLNNNNISKEAQCITKGSKVITILMDVAGEYSLDGELVGYIITAVNITMRKMFEEELANTVAFQQALIDAIPVAIYYKDTALNIIGYNKKFAEIYEVGGKDLIGKRMNYSEAGESFTQLVGGINNELLKSHNPVVYETKLKNKNIVVYKSVYKKNDGTLGGIIGAMLDVTRERKMQEDKAQIQANLAKQDKLASLGQLVAGIAHEMNNPLSIILGYAQVLSRNKTFDEKALAAVASILEAANRSRKIVANMLDFARGDALKLSTVSITEILEKTFAIVAYKLKENAVELVKNYNFSGDDLIMGGFIQLQQVFLNIILNAVDEMSKGGTLSVGVSKKDKNIIITFKDTGKGISKEAQAKLFEPFFTTKEVGKGTGLGLSIVYGIIKAHKGDILVDSIENEGTTFTVVLPERNETV